MSDGYRRVVRARRKQAEGPWTPFIDSDGNQNPPTDMREVLVFLSGDRTIDAPRDDDAGWGLRLGWYDHDKQYWRVGGRPEGYVTHWMDAPQPPKGA